MDSGYERGVLDGLELAAAELDREAAETEAQFGIEGRGGVAAAVMAECARIVRDAAATRRSRPPATGS